MTIAGDMYNTLDFHKLLRLLQADLTFLRLKDPEEKMRYFVKKHYSSVIKYMNHSMRILSRAIEKNQRTALETLVPDWWNVYIEHAQALYQNCSAQVETNNAMKIHSFVGEILAKVTFDWTDMDSLFVLALYFGMRALCSLILDSEKDFISDVSHTVHLVNFLSYDFLVEGLKDRNSLVKMQLQLTFVLYASAFPERESIRKAVRNFVDDIKKSLNDYAVAVDLDRPDLERNKILDELINENKDESALESCLLQSGNWKYFIALFEFIEDYDYNAMAQSVLSLNSELFEENLSKAKLSGLAFQLNDKVALEETESGGRCYVADTHIPTGEQILLERPISAVIFQGYFSRICATCQSLIQTPFPCSGCTELTFCSGDCSRIAMNTFHSLECGCYSKIIGQDQFTIPHAVRLYSVIGIQRELKKLQQAENERLMIDEPELKKTNAELAQDYIGEYQNCTLATFGRDGDRDIFTRAVDSLLVHRWVRHTEREIIHNIWSLNVVALFIIRGKLSEDFVEKHNLGKFAAFLESIACRMLSICTNGFGWQDVLSEDDKEYFRIGSGICFVGSFFNHSCKPNITWSITKETGLQMYALRPIEPKEFLCISYGPRPPTPFNDRQRSLKNNYCFLCQCELCLAEASELRNALKCLNPKIECSGPLVLNRHHSCLKCGYKSPYAEYSLFIQKLDAHREQFKNLYKKLQFKHGKSNASLLNKIAFHTTGALMRKKQKAFLKLKGILTKAPGGISTLERLEKEFENIQEVVYSHSFLFLEQCVNLLKAIKWEGFAEGRSHQGLIFKLMKSVEDCLENARPEEILSSEIGSNVVENVAYCSEFLYNYIADNYAGRYDLVSVQNALETLKRIDASLIEILKPLADCANNSPLEASKDKAGPYYLGLFMDAEKRMISCDNFP